MKITVALGKTNAVADKSLITNMFAELALVEVNPFLIPTNVVYAKDVKGETESI